jgi:glycosyltransferase involved in cell wall biosynthesis
MKVGSLVYATDQGLGILAKSFYDHGIVTDPVVVRHGTHPTHEDWYPKAPVVSSLHESHSLAIMRSVCASVDVMLFFETPFVWELIRYCQSVGTKTALMTMYECTPDPLSCYPDIYLCPSLLDLREFSDRPELVDASVASFQPCYGTQGVVAYYTPVPVCSDPSCPCTHKIQWRQRERAEVFVHNAGHGSFHDRNGTKLVIHAWDVLREMSKSIPLIIRSQQPGISGKSKSSNIQFEFGSIPYSDLYTKGDVFLFPERFNGLSLPLQEAYASGMLVMGMDRFPSNEWLPCEPLIPVACYSVTQIGRAYRPFQCAETYPKIVAEHIDSWYGRVIYSFSQRGRQWAEANSWGKVGPRYIDVLERLCGGRTRDRESVVSGAGTLTDVVPTKSA